MLPHLLPTRPSVSLHHSRPCCRPSRTLCDLSQPVVLPLAQHPEQKRFDHAGAAQVHELGLWRLRARVKEGWAGWGDEGLQGRQGGPGACMRAGAHTTSAGGSPCSMCAGAAAAAASATAAAVASLAAVASKPHRQLLKAPLQRPCSVAGEVPPHFSAPQVSALRTWTTTTRRGPGRMTKQAGTRARAGTRLCSTASAFSARHVADQAAQGMCVGRVDGGALAQPCSAALARPSSRPTSLQHEQRGP